MATLTYVYADSTAVLGPLAVYAEPHCYDLCSQHAGRLTVPRGWEVLRLDLAGQPRTARRDELSAIVDAVREPEPEPEREPEPEPARRPGRHVIEPPAEVPQTRRAHLRVLREQS